MLCAGPVDGVAVTVIVYVPTVVPGVPPPLLLPPEFVPPQPPAAATMNARSVRKTTCRRHCLGSRNKTNRQTSDITAISPGQPILKPRPGGDSLNELASAAVDMTVMVALPLVAVGVNVMVCGAVKFWSGVPKLQVGKSTAFIGSPLTTQLRVTEPANEFAAVTMMSCPADCPGEEIDIVTELEAGARLIPGAPTVIVTAVEVEVA